MDATENETLARVWIHVSMDPIVEGDQTVKAFNTAVRRSFFGMAPKDKALCDEYHTSVVPKVA